MRPWAFHPAIAATLAAATLGGCGGAAFDGHVFRNDELSFRVKGVPPGWHSEGLEGTLLAFRDDGTQASVAVSGRCGKDGDDVPLESLTHHLFLQFTERTVESQTRVQLDGREALHTELLARLDGVEKRFSVFVLKKNGCVYDFVRVAPSSTSVSPENPFFRFVEGFETIKP